MKLISRGRILPMCCCFGLLAACGGKSPSQSERHYELSGQVTAIDPKVHSATVNAAAIPNFMEAMTMEYPVKSETEFGTLHVGDRIRATVNVYGDDRYDLSNVRKSEAAK